MQTLTIRSWRGKARLRADQWTCFATSCAICRSLGVTKPARPMHPCRRHPNSRQAWIGVGLWVRNTLRHVLPDSNITRECYSATRVRGIGKRTPKTPMLLELGLKDEVRAVAPKSARTANNLFCSMRYWQSGSFFSFIHELSVPAQKAVNGSLMQVREEFRTPPQQIPMTRVPR